MSLPMTYLERKLRGDRTLAIVNGRIYEPDYMESDQSNFIKMGDMQTALIDGPSCHRLEELWETTYKKELDGIMEEEVQRLSPDKIKGTKLGDEIVRTELKYFIVFKVFRKFVSEKSKISNALGKIKSEYKQQEDAIQDNIRKHLRGEINDDQLKNYGKQLYSKKSVTKASALAKKLAKKMKGSGENNGESEESVPEMSEENQKESVFSNSISDDLLVVDDLVYVLQKCKKNSTVVKINSRNYAPLKNTPLMQTQDLIDIYKENLLKKYKDMAFFSQPRLRKLREMQVMIEEELKRDIYKQKMLEIAETDRPDVMWAIMGFNEFVNKGSDGNYFLFPPGKIAVMVEWRKGKIGNGQPVNWEYYYAPNISGNGHRLTSLCLAGYNNEKKSWSREAKIADYLAHAVRTMQQGYIPGSVTVYHSLNKDDSKFREMLISKSEMKRRGLRSLNID